MQACQRGNNNVVPQQRSAGLHPRVDPKLAQWLRHARHTLTSTSCNAAERHIHKLHCQPHRAQACVSHASSLQLVPNRHGDAKIQRRHLLQQVLLATTAAALSGFAEPAQADLFRDLVKGYVRPEVAADQAIMQLMDARGTLMELKALAATSPNSQERFEARRVLPGMATRLRQVSSAAPVAAALASGTASEATLSYLYGGSAAEGVSELSMAIPVYEAIGRVITISGRTIRKQAQASPEYAEAAIATISKLLAACPQEDLDRAQEMRKARMNAKAV